MDLHCSGKKKPFHVHSSRTLCAVVALWVTLCANLLSLPTARAEAADFNSDIEQLDRRFQTLSAELYRARARDLQAQHKPDSIEQLHRRVHERLNDDDLISAIALIQLHIPLVQDNLDNRLSFDLVALLLKYNAWETAQALYDYINRYSESSLVSGYTFIFARHYLARHQWQRIIDTLTGRYDDLAEEDAHYARLMTGIALQKRHQHRKSVEHYDRIDPSSRYYVHAQLNRAIAYLRQGWWTDAQRTINATLDSQAAHKTDEMVNRLNLVLGYSLLQNEYYRNSRNAFRRISLDSRYTNRALLGLGLSAANQEDFIGALNALSILKQKNTRDLSVDESYLLLPFVYNKLNQQMTASATYSEAIGYYQSRIGEIEGLIAGKAHLRPDVAAISADNSTIVVNGNALDYARRYPRVFLANIRRLEKISANIARHAIDLPASLEASLKNLKADHGRLYGDIITELLGQRLEYLGSYLNQSRYGLASLYDSSFSSEN